MFSLKISGKNLLYRALFRYIGNLKLLLNIARRNKFLTYTCNNVFDSRWHDGF